MPQWRRSETASSPLPTSYLPQSLSNWRAHKDACVAFACGVPRDDETRPDAAGEFDRTGTLGPRGERDEPLAPRPTPWHPPNRTGALSPLRTRPRLRRAILQEEGTRLLGAFSPSAWRGITLGSRGVKGRRSLRVLRTSISFRRALVKVHPCILRARPGSISGMVPCRLR